MKVPLFLPLYATLCALVTSVCAGPVSLVANPDDVSTRMKSVLIDVLANDTKPVGATLTITEVTQGEKGRVFIRRVPSPAVFYAGGMAFDGTDTFTYTVSDGMGGTSTATVTVTNPFYELRGSFVQLVTSLDGVVGTVTPTLTIGGTVTGKLTIGGKPFTLRGPAGTDGVYTQSFPRSDLPDLVVTLTFENVDDQATVSGEVTGDDDDYIIDPIVLNGTALPEEVAVGNYTLLLPPDADPTNPRGTGFARLKLSPSGRAIFLGRLADDTTCTALGVMNANAEMVIFAPTNTKPRGEVAGRLTFESGVTRTVVGGDLAWRKPEQERTTGLFLDGFNATIEVNGASYIRPPRGERALQYSDVEEAKADLNTSGDGIADIAAELSVSLFDRVVADPPNDSQVSVKISRKNGTFSGKFTLDGATQPLTFIGVLQQEANVAAGFFRSEDQTGTVEFFPR